MTTDESIFQERPIRVERPTSFYQYLIAPDGCYLGVGDQNSLATFDYVDDKSVWEVVGRDSYRHPTTGLELASTTSTLGVQLRLEGNTISASGAAGKAATYSVERGPADLPSNYLKHIQENGWVCLPCIFDDEMVDGLQQASCTGKYENGPLDPSQPPVANHPAVARATVEPVSGWVIRQYMQTDAIKLGHAPAFAVLPPDDGKREILAWHTDFPYLWGITPRVAGDRIPVHNAGQFCMAIQRNIAITDFTKETGATCFKLGSHAKSSPPPDDWGTGAQYAKPGYRETHGLPYSGPEAEVLEAPAGSMVFYDARTWHRTGFNRTDHKRGAMLQAIVPMYIMPFMDTAAPYKAFVNSPVYAQLNDRERREMETLMVHKIVGPLGQFAIGVDAELTGMTTQ